MAYSFGGTHSNHLTIAPAVRGVGSADGRPISFGCRLKLATTASAAWVFSNYGTGDPGFGCIVGAGTTAVMRCYGGYPSGAYTDSSSFSNDATDWHSYLWTYNTGSPGALAFYRDGALVSSTTKTWGQIVSGGTSPDDLSIIGSLWDEGANAGVAGFFVNGSLADCAVWGAVLDAAEAAAYTNGASPLLLRPASLISYVPLIGDNNQDLKRGDWTVTGTLTKQADHPRIYLPSAPRLQWGTSVPPTPPAATALVAVGAADASEESGSWTPTASALLLAFVGATAAGTPAKPTISDTGGLTWTEVGDVTTGNVRETLYWAYAESSPGSRTATVASTGATSVVMRIVEAPGKQIRAISTVPNVGGAANALADPAGWLDGAAIPGNHIVSGGMFTGVDPVDPWTGFTELGETVGGAVSLMQTQFATAE